MILDQTRNISTRLSRSKTGALAAGAAMMAAAVVAMGPRLALAQSADAEVTFRRDADDTADLNSDGNADAADRPASSSNAVASGGAAEIRSAASPETSVKAKAMIYRSADGKTSTITAKEGRLHISEAEPSSGGKVTIRRGASIGPAAANEKYPRVSATAAMSQSVAPRTEGKARYEEAAGRTEDAKPVIKERNAGEETDPVEERLERLEKLVERLLEQRSPRTSGLPDSKAAPRNTPGLPATTKPVRKEAEIHESIRKEIDLQLSRGAQDVRRAEVEVRRAVEAAKHSAEAARRAVEAEGWQRSNPDVELRWRVGEPGAGLPGLPKKLVREETSYSSGTTSESMTMQRRMLDEQRRMLHEQIKQIENQIQELEKFEGFMRSMIHPKEKAKDKPSPDAGISN